MREAAVSESTASIACARPCGVSMRGIASSDRPSRLFSVRHTSLVSSSKKRFRIASARTSDAEMARPRLQQLEFSSRVHVAP